MFHYACRADGGSVVEAPLLHVAVRNGVLTPRVPARRDASKIDGPRASRSSGEDRLEADFRLATEKVLAGLEPERPE